MAHNISFKRSSDLSCFIKTTKAIDLSNCSPNTAHKRQLLGDTRCVSPLCSRWPCYDSVNCIAWRCAFKEQDSALIWYGDIKVIRLCSTAWWSLCYVRKSMQIAGLCPNMPIANTWRELARVIKALMLSSWVLIPAQPSLEEVRFTWRYNLSWFLKLSCFGLSITYTVYLRPEGMVCTSISDERPPCSTWSFENVMVQLWLVLRLLARSVGRREGSVEKHCRPILSRLFWSQWCAEAFIANFKIWIAMRDWADTELGVTSFYLGLQAYTRCSMFNGDMQF